MCIAAFPLGACHGTARPAPPRGFVALFNGRNLSGWRGLPGDPPKVAKMNPIERADAQRAADARMRQHWRVTSDGILAFDGQGDNLCTARNYADFQLLVDWRIPKGGDSGIYLRGNPQVQIWDKAPVAPVAAVAAQAASAPNDSQAGSGGLYNNQHHRSTPLVVADLPPGQWNAFDIQLVGDRVTVHLNGALVVDDTPIENYWQRGQPFPLRGSIELQAHGGPLEFRNIFIREIRPGRRGGKTMIPTAQPAATAPTTTAKAHG